MTNETPKPVVIESGAAFAADTDAEISVEASFLESGNQLQQVFVGLEPVLLIQPEYDADVNQVKFVLTAVDLDPTGLIEVLEVILDAAREMAIQQAEMRDEHAATEDFDLANLPGDDGAYDSDYTPREQLDANDNEGE